MSNFLDDLFAARVPEIPYSWTYTSVHPFNGTPGVGFATGVLTFKEWILTPQFVIPSRYVDSSVKFWHAYRTHLDPSSIEPNPVSWVNQLMIVQQPDRSGSSYSVIYGNRTNFDIEFGSFSPEVYTGSGFPGSEETRTVILVGRRWLDVECLVLAPPGEFNRG